MKLVVWLGAAITAAALASAANAEVYTGSTTGCFSSTTTCSTSFTTTASDPSEMSFTGVTFNGVSGPTLDLGVISLLGINGIDPVATNFLLKVTFSQPGSTTGTFDANLTGAITPGGPGSVVVDFGAAQTLQFLGGSFTLLVDDITLTGCHTDCTADSDHISGHINNVVSTPETSTWGMMILGFAAIGFMVYRREQNGQTLRLA